MVHLHWSSSPNDHAPAWTSGRDQVDRRIQRQRSSGIQRFLHQKRRAKRGRTVLPSNTVNQDFTSSSSTSSQEFVALLEVAQDRILWMVIRVQQQIVHALQVQLGFVPIRRKHPLGGTRLSAIEQGIPGDINDGSILTK